MSLVRYLLDEHIDPVLRTQLLRHEPDMGETIEELRLIWGASRPQEFQDQIVYLPLA